MTLAVGDNAPDFTLPSDKGDSISLKGLRGKTVVLYFYPKDDTSGCTAQACQFRDLHPSFDTEKALVIGISKNSVKSHQKFKDKYSLCFPLLSDEEGTVCNQYGVWVEKSMYGRKYFGIERTTFLIDKEGIIQKIWPKVKVPNHGEAVLKAIVDLI